MSQSSDSSVSSWDYQSSSSEDDEERFIITIPSLVAVYGKSRSGKSTLVIDDFIAGDMFSPQPELFYLMIPKTGVESTDKRKMKDFVATVNEIYQPFNKNEESITVVNSTDELNLEISKADPKIPKLIFIDDMLTSKIFDGLYHIINEIMHRGNACVILTSQLLYMRDAKPIRDNCNYMVVFPGQALKRFFLDYTDGVATQLLSMLYNQRDEEFDVEGYSVEIAHPILIKKDDIKSEITVWRDVYDIEPKTLSILGDKVKKNNTSDKAVRRFILEQQK